MTFVPSPEQRAIIDHRAEPLRVAAGAGTGKTTTIVERLARSVREGTDPARALGVTFTNKAADELRNRLRESIGARPDGREVEVATYHSFASSILDEFGVRIGYEPGATLMDEGHRSELAVRVLRNLEGTSLDLTALSHRRDEVLTVADALNDNLLDADDLVAAAPENPDEIWQRRLALAEAAGAFVEAKRILGLIEYSDLIRHAVTIVTEHPDVASTIEGRYEIVLLDEYQDTDPAQRLLLTALFASRTPVTAVGDTDQTIYEWRGASIENFDSFPTDFPTTSGSPAPTLPLSINRRSDTSIVALANRVRENLPAVEGAEPLRPRSEAGAGTVMTAWFRTDVEEATWIADEMRDRHDDGVAFADMAVLCRTRESIRPIAAALRIGGIPYSVGSMGELLHVPEIADLVAWLSVLADPADDASLLRILLGGKYRLGLADVAAVSRGAKRSKADGLIDRLLSGHIDVERQGAVAALASFTATYQSLFKRSQASSVAGIVDALVDDLDYWSEVAALPAARSTTVRLNLDRFIDLANQWRPIDGHAILPAFLRYLVALDESGRSEALDTVDVPTDDAVLLLTAHGAKGLEWRDVYVPALASGVFPSGVRLYHDPRRTPLVLPFEVRLDANAMAAVRDEPDEDLRKEVLKKRHLDQEWRLAYVAVTRAKQRLVMSGHAWDGEIKNARTPSPLLEIARALPGSVTGPTLEDPGERPDPVRFVPPAEPPDPLFPAGWGAALRSTITDPSWIAAEHPDLVDVVDERFDQLNLLMGDLAVPTTPRTPRFATSVTNLVAMAECPLKFRWIHHDRLPRKPRESARRGTAFHKRIELHNQGIATLDLDDETVSGITGDGIEAMSGLGDTTPPDELVVDPWAVFTDSRFHRVKPVLVETPFEITMDGRSLRGKVDAIYHAEDRWEIVDYKSGRKNTSDARSVQLMAYAVAAARGALGAHPPDEMDLTFAYFGASPAAEVTERVDQGWIDSASTTISSLLAAAEGGPFEPTPSPACRWCDFVHHCPAGQDALDRLT